MVLRSYVKWHVSFEESLQESVGVLCKPYNIHQKLKQRAIA